MRQTQNGRSRTTACSSSWSRSMVRTGISSQISLAARLLSNACKSSKILKDVLRKETGLLMRTTSCMSGLRPMVLTNGQSVPSSFKADVANSAESDGLTF